MPNIDLVFLFQPIIVTIIVFLLIFYYRKKSTFSKWVLLYSLLAYLIAIVIKVVFQIFTINSVLAFNNNILLGIYYGLQTVFLEVGLAYIFARYAVSKHKLTVRNAPAYGAGLAFWENGIYLGVFSLVNLIATFLILGSGSPEANMLYSQLVSTQPGLFLPPIEGIPFILLGTLERISSIIVHFAWGYLCVIAAVTGKRKYFYVALPMGFLDFLVPFASILTIFWFEIIIFVWAIFCLFIAKVITKTIDFKAIPIQEQPSQPSASLTMINFKRSLSYGKVYIILGIVISVVMIGLFGFIGSAVTSSLPEANLFQTLIPTILPLFAMIGSMGALMIFVSDRVKGVYEYLIAYGVNPFSIFWSIVISSVGLTGLVLVITVPFSAIIMYVTTGTLATIYLQLIFLYTIPLSIASTMFSTMAGMIWSSLTTRRAGLNSPVGLAPLLGIAPILLVLFISEFLSLQNPSMLVYIVGAVSGLLILAVILLLALAGKKLTRERFLGNI